jgi:hypothetical protein
LPLENKLESILLPLKESLKNTSLQSIQDYEDSLHPIQKESVFKQYYLVLHHHLLSSEGNNNEESQKDLSDTDNHIYKHNSDESQRNVLFSLLQDVVQNLLSFE